MTSRWEWVREGRRYRDTRTGRFLSPTTVLALRDDFLADQARAIGDLTARLVAGDTAIGDWLVGMRDLVRDATLGEYTFGRGGRNAMGEGDLAAVARAVEGQYGYLQGFAEAVRAGELTARQVGARAALYAASARQAFERGKAAAWGNPPLPVYPGQDSECRANCRCHWRIEADDDEWRATWVLDTSAHDNCATCRERAREYAPLVVKKEAA